MKFERFGLVTYLHPDSLLAKWVDKNWKTWELKESHAILKCADKNKIFVEAGAWVAPYSFLFQHVYRKCVAIEPDSRSVRDVEKNIKFSNTKKIQVLRTGISDKRTVASLSHSGANSGSSMINAGGSHTIVEVDALDSIFKINDIKWSDIGLICLDVEGSEAKILPDIAGYLEKHHTPILVSYHPNVLSQAKIDILQAMMAGIYKKVEKITENVYFYLDKLD